MSLRPLTALAALFGALALSACGKAGALERPGPLFANERSTTRAADEANRQAQDPGRPVDTVDPRERAVDPAPSRTIPIEGTNRGPGGVAPPGALPDPYANPRR